MATFALVVDLHPWPAPVDDLVARRLAAPLLERFGGLRFWHPAGDAPDARGEATTQDPDLGAVVLSGSMAMLGDNPSWLNTLGSALDHWMAHRVPVLGTCFGHQFIAHHLGGRIGSFDTRHIALAPLHVVDPEDPLFLDLPPLPELFWTHRDFVAEVPPTLIVTATSESVPVEAFRHRDLPVWGIQAHPEADTGLVQAVARVDAEAEPVLRRRPWSAYATPAAKSILHRFAAHAHGLAPRITD